MQNHKIFKEVLHLVTMKKGGDICGCSFLCTFSNLEPKGLKTTFSLVSCSNSKMTQGVKWK